MSLTFTTIRDAVRTQLARMCDENNKLFEVDLDKDKLWEVYLETIPAADNPIYRTRREYDCSCCRHFIKGIGNVVELKNGNITTVWDCETSDPKWNAVLKAMSDYVKGCPIMDVFITKDAYYGTERNFMLDEDGKSITWDHFSYIVPSKFVWTKRNNYSLDTIDTQRSQYRDIRQVYKRSLDELKLEAVDTVLDLINQGSLYKGDEYKSMIQQFRTHKKFYDALVNEDRDK